MKFIINLFCSLVLFAPASLNAEVVERMVAIVNDSIVSLSDLDQLQKNLKTDGLIDKALIDLYNRKELLASPEARLEFIIDERILDGEVIRQGVVSPIEKVEGEIKKIVAENGTSREQLKASLKKRNIGYAEYQNFIKTSLERQSILSKEVASKIKISDDEIASHFIQNSKSSKPLVFEYQLSHILFLGSGAAPISRAKEVLSKINSGGNFESIAAQYSEDPQFTQGGAFGVVRVGDVIPALEKALSGLRTGDVTAPVAMPDGVHLFKVLKRDLVPSPELEAQKANISRTLFAQSFARQYKSWIEQRRQASYIRRNLK
jgi:peptidyl-prolyl cis-trans isomerase SurA